MRRNISPALRNATQEKLDEWTMKIQSRVDKEGLELKFRQKKEQELKVYAENKQQLATKFKEAHEAGVSLRELSRITGISSATIGRWIKKLHEKEKQQHAEGQTHQS